MSHKSFVNILRSCDFFLRFLSGGCFGLNHKAKLFNLQEFGRYILTAVTVEMISNLKPHFPRNVYYENLNFSMGKAWQGFTMKLTSNYCKIRQFAHFLDIPLAAITIFWD